ncbi:MAG: TonB family protein [Opitutaceae bacterium]|nr:TonB family protein [Opitutaceae bacterium]
MKNALLLLGLLAMVADGFGASTPQRPDNAAVADSAPLLQTWTPAVYPPEARSARVGGFVTVRIVVDEAGRVTQARVLDETDPRLGENAVTAVRTWGFAPARDAGRAVAMSLDVPFNFDPSKPEPKKPGLLPPAYLLPKPAPREPAELTASPLGDYPESLRDRKLAGRVVFECEVTAEGRAGQVRVLGATHADFVPPALEGSQRWEFKPARQGDLPVRAELRGAVSFDAPRTTRAAVLAANRLTAPDGTAPADAPRPDIVVDPVWPHAALLKGEKGSASVELIVRSNGTVGEVKVREASAPEFGHALAAAMEAWVFEPAEGRAGPVEVTLLKRAEFTPPAAADEKTDPLARLLVLARADAIRGADGLDAPLSPVYRVSPVYPAALRSAGKPEGEAIVEFVIDREGRGRLPRVVSATHDAFGWAAATAIQQWVFRAPRRGGAPTDVLVRIPFRFSPPSD